MNDFRVDYESYRENILVPLAKKLQRHLEDHFNTVPRIDRIAVRAKSVDRFIKKAEKRTGSVLKYSDPMKQIQDQIGARIISFYLSDVEEISKTILRYFRRIEEQTLIPESESEFGYVGKHFILFIPTDLFDETLKRELSPSFFELQIKTLFQHAWSEANHDLAYKPSSELSSEQKRKIAFTAAQAWGADKMFEELHSDLVLRSTH